MRHTSFTYRLTSDGHVRSVRDTIAFTSGSPTLVGLLILFLLMSGCSKPRTWTTPIEHHLYYEVETQPASSSRMQAVVSRNGDIMTVTFVRKSMCTEVQYDVKRVFLKKEVRYPGKKYHTYLGTLITVLGVPSLYIGAVRSTGTARALNLGVAFGLFIGPGVGLIAAGQWEKQHEKTTTSHLGKMRQKVREKTYPCGSAPASGMSVEILTRTGYVPVGKTDGQGRISFSVKQMPALSRDGMEYLEVWALGKPMRRIYLKGGPENVHDDSRAETGSGQKDKGVSDEREGGEQGRRNTHGK